MSLNGLDDVAIREAHEAAVAEPGGWFLLQYASRDEIGLLGRGSGGIVDIRNAIAQCEEPSPLYGFLKYRRRNVVIKYLPETCSRLVQARVTVHFSAVCERFAPYNATFSIADAKELKDTKLSAACSLHTASSSTSSSTSSLRRRRLVEIAEEEEEEQRATKRQSVVKEEDRPGIPSEARPGRQPPHQTVPPPPVTLNAQLAKSPNESQFAGTAEPPSFTGAERPSSPAKSLDARRLSSQLTRPEMYSYSSYSNGKPKVKLAPRPSLDVSGRPRTSAGTGTYRPVSAIPAGFKLFSKGSRKGRDSDRTGENASRQIDEEKPDLAAALAAEIASIPIPETPPDTFEVKRPQTSGGRPSSSSGISVKSVATIAAATTARQNAMTPEKARLMKAMKLREKKRKLSTLPVPTIDVVAVPFGPEPRDVASLDEPSDSVSVTGASFAGSSNGRPGSSGGLSAGNTFTPNAGPSDSAIDVGLSAVDQASIDTHTTDSHPASPLAVSSEIGDSTKASSLSESTDETVQTLHDMKTEIGVDGQDGADDANHGAVLSAGGGSIRSSVTENEPEAGEEHVLSREMAPNVELESHQHKTLASGEATTAVSEDSGNSGDSGDSGATALIDPPILDAVEIPTAGATGSSRPTTPTVPEPAASLLHEAPVVWEPSATEAPTASTEAPAAVPAISVAEPRNSHSTIRLEDHDSDSIDTKRAKRRPLIDPIRTDLVGLPGKSTDVNLSDDDELMEELQSAAVQEAKPITVSKSPINPVFPSLSPSQRPTTSEGENTERAARTVSNPIRGSLLAPGDVTTSSARSVSSGAAFLHKMAQQNSANLAPKKSNIGSSISQRIKALEKLSGSAPGPATEVTARVERPTSTFFSVRKPGGRDLSKSPLITERASSLTRDKTPSPPTSQESSPEMPKPASRDRSGSMASRLSVFEGGNLPRGRPESVQVRARIIRDPAQPFPKMPDSHFDPSEPSQLDFKQSPLVVDHQRAMPLSSLAYDETAPSNHAMAGVSTERIQKRESIQERRMSKEKRRSQSQDRSTTTDEPDATRPRRRSSLSIVKDFIKERRGSVLAGRSPSSDNLNINNLAALAPLPTPSKSPSRPPSVHATHGLARRLSISSRRSTSTDRDTSTPPLNTPMSPSLMTEVGGSGDEGKSSPSDLGHRKTGSGSKNRASRFMRRLSSSLGTARKTATPAISPTVAEEDEVFSSIPPSRGSSALQPSIVSYIGDVNVQFPDNLLWKRRTMCLDSQGFLILSAGNGVSATTAAVSMSSSDRPGGAVKRYHLCDFRLPYIPEMEVQELPNSVCLDFIDGSGLQVACEDRAGQLNVLQILQEAHQNHTSFGQ